MPLLGPLKPTECQAGKVSGFKARLLHSTTLPVTSSIPLRSPQPQHMAFLHRQVDRISLPSSSASSSCELVWGLREELGHL